MELFKTVFTYVMIIILFLQLLRIRNNIKIKTKLCLYTAVHASFNRYQWNKYNRWGSEWNTARSRDP